MNLSGNNIKKYILRRYSIDELESIFNQKLNNQSRNFKHYAHMSSNKFMVIVVSLITEEILVQLTDGWVEDSPIPEEGLYEFIQEIFGERIIKKYDELTNMNLQESIRRILREETELPSYIRRRVNMEELDDLVLDVKELIDSDYDKTDAIYDTIRQFIATKKSFKFDYETERQYWDSYIDIEKPLVNYVKTKLNI